MTIDEIRKNLNLYLKRVKAGETVVILDADQPVAEIKPVKTGDIELRPYGLCEGEFRVPDDFDDPLPDDTLRLFEG